MSLARDVGGLLRSSTIIVVIGLLGGYLAGVLIGLELGGSDLVGWQRVASADVAAVEVVSVTDATVVYVRDSAGQNTRCVPTQGGMFECSPVAAEDVEPTPAESPTCEGYTPGKPAETPGYVVSAVHHRVCTEESASFLDVIAISDGSVWIWHAGTGAWYNFGASTAAPLVGAVLGGLAALVFVRLRRGSPDRSAVA